MNPKEVDMKGRREERNVLDELLESHDEDEFDVELYRNDKKIRNTVKVNEANNDARKLIVTREFKTSSNGKRKHGFAASRKSPVSGRAESESCESCSCDEHSSLASRSPPRSERSLSPQQKSFADSSSFKIKIHKNSNSRTIKISDSPHYKRKFEDKDDVEENGNDRKKRKKPSKHDYESLLKYFFKDSCYFVVKSNNLENVLISKRKGVWSTPLQNEIKLNSAFNEFRNVILIFSVKESGKFQGFARLSSEAQYDLKPVDWVLPPGVSSSPFGGVFYVDWICHNELSFTKTSYLYNPFNENKPVKIARDGQEIAPRVGEELCRLFSPDKTVDLIPFLKRMKKQTSNRPKKRNYRGPFVPGLTNFHVESSRRDFARQSISSEVYAVRSPRNGRLLSSIDRSRIASRRDYTLHEESHRFNSGYSHNRTYDSDRHYDHVRSPSNYRRHRDIRY